MENVPRAFVPPDKSVKAVYAEFRPGEVAPIKPAEMSFQQWTDQQYNERVKDLFFAKIIEQELAGDYDATVAFRMIAAWRLTRLMARLRGFIGESDFLGEMPVINWTDSEEPGSPYKIPTYYSAKARTLIALASEETPEIALLPPDPSNRLLTETWASLITKLGEDIAAFEGTKDFPLMGSMGLAPLADPNTSHEAWPSPSQIIAFETIMVEEALNCVVQSSTARARSHFQTRYGFSWEECQQLFRMAKRTAVEMTKSDVDEDRAIAKLRLEDFIDRSKNTFYNPQTELGGMKLLAQISGLTKFDEKDKDRDVIDVIGRVSDERKQRRLEGGEG